MSAVKSEASFVPLIVRRIVNRVGRPLGINPFPRAFNYALPTKTHADTFDEIFNQNLWGSSESASGVGSELATTKQYREALVARIKSQGFTSMFDAPCGDLVWMPSVLAEVDIHYEGGDIAPIVVEKVKQQHPGLAIRTFDISRDAFPKADVWHCRDCLFHLPFADIQLALRNFVNSGIPYALLTTHRARLLHKNLDLETIGFRMLDLERAPINLPRALAYLPDYNRGTDFPRYVGLWSREMIQQALESA